MIHVATNRPLEDLQHDQPVRLDGADLAAGQDQLLREARGRVPEGRAQCTHV